MNTAHTYKQAFQRSVEELKKHPISYTDSSQSIHVCLSDVCLSDICLSLSTVVHCNTDSGTYWVSCSYSFKEEKFSDIWVQRVVCEVCIHFQLPSTIWFFLAFQIQIPCLNMWNIPIFAEPMSYTASIESYNSCPQMFYWSEHLLTLQLDDINVTQRRKLVTQWLRFWLTGWQAFSLCSIQ